MRVPLCLALCALFLSGCASRPPKVAYGPHELTVRVRVEGQKALPKHVEVRLCHYPERPWRLFQTVQNCEYTQPDRSDPRRGNFYFVQANPGDRILVSAWNPSSKDEMPEEWFVVPEELLVPINDTSLEIVLKREKWPFPHPRPVTRTSGGDG